VNRNHDWSYSPLSEVVDVLDSRRVPVKASDRAKLGGDVPYYGATGQAGVIDRAIFDEPLVLLGEDGAPFLDPLKAKAYLIEGPAWVNNHAHVLRPLPGLDRRFLRHYLDVFDYRRFANGTTRLKLTQSAMRRIPVPVPKLDDQQRIVETLEDHLSRLDAADRWLTDTERRIRAWMAGVSDSLIWRPNFAEVTVASVLREPMRNGRSDRASEDGRGVRTLTLTAVTRNEFADEHTKVTITSPEVAEGLWLEEGDIFVQRANTPDLVGTSARYSGPNKWAIFPDLLIRVRPDETVISSQFLNMALRTERAHRSLRAHAKGLAGSMPKIDQKSVGNTVVPLPSMPDQQRLVDTLEYAETGTRNLLNVSRTAGRRSVALRRATLSAAFDGRLTGRREDAEIIEELADV